MENKVWDMADSSENLAVIAKITTAVSHELRIPLTAIKNSVYFLKMLGVEGRDPRIAEHMSLINSRIENCVQIIGNLQSFMQQKEPVCKKTRIDEILTECISVTLTPFNIRVTTHFQRDLPPLMIDPFQMRQVFDNIIRNAMDAMEGKGMLTVTASVKGDGVVVEFEDTGRGIPAENLGKIFDPLFSTKLYGPGLGLAVCKQVIDAHKGCMEVESNVGRGTKFRVKLPLHFKG